MTLIVEAENTALQQYSASIEFIERHYRPGDLLCFAFQSAETSKWIQVFRTFEEAIKPETMASMQKANDAGHNIYVAMNVYKGPRRTEDNIAAIRNLWAELDANGRENLNKIFDSKLVLEPTTVNESSPNKFHAIWAVDEVSVEQAKALLKLICAEFNGDSNAIDAARVLRLPGFKNHKYPEKPEVEVVHLASRTARLTAIDFQLVSKQSSTVSKSTQPTGDSGPIPEGVRDNWLASQAGKYRADGDEYDAIYAKLQIDNEKCLPPKDDADLKRIARSYSNYQKGTPITVTIGGRMPGQGVAPSSAAPDNVAQPDGHYTEEIAEQEDQAQEEQYQASLLNQEPMPETEEEAQAQLATRPHALLRTPTEGAPYFDADHILYGISGRIIRKIDAESESHPAGNLLEFLVGFGNLIGRGPYFMHESTKHFTNEFGIRVGESALSRKGTGKDRVQELLWKLDHRWMTDCVKGGFGSGQAIIQAVTDEITQIRLVKGKRVETIVAQNVPDKRLLISQGEFSGVLKMASMEGSLFSEVFRDAFDCKKLENTVKGTPNKCLEPFISCCCDTNLEDLKSLLQDSPNAGNGFGNRFTFAYVERTKDNGNGRISRAIAEMALAQVDRRIQQSCSIAKQLMIEDRDYFLALGKAQTGTSDITEYLCWFLGCLNRAVKSKNARPKS